MVRYAVLLTVLLGFSAPDAVAQSCGGLYRVAPGDSLSLIAARFYKNAYQWNALFAANQTVIGEDPDTILAGTDLQLPCIKGRPVLANAAPVNPGSAASGGIRADSTAPRDQAVAQIESVWPLPPFSPRVRVVTGNGLPPFSDENLPEGGVMTAIVTAALRAGLPDGDFDIRRARDWSSQLDPILLERQADLSYPWTRPDCQAAQDAAQCGRFVYSEPMFELLIVLFVNAKQPRPFASDADLAGLTLCRPEGLMVDMLDAKGRFLLRDRKITLMRAENTRDCFQALHDGSVDAVVMNEFSGRSVLAQMGLEEDIVGLTNRPLSVATLHAVAARNNPEAMRSLDGFNAGLRLIKANGVFQAIMDRQLSRVWSGL
jgi:polar amino acid transport system substrate-binding protein